MITWSRVLRASRGRRPFASSSLRSWLGRQNRRFVKGFGQLRNSLDSILNHFLHVGIRFRWQCLGKVTNRKGVLVNYVQLLRFHSSSQLHMALVDFFQNPIASAGAMVKIFFFMCVVYLSVMGAGG